MNVVKVNSMFPKVLCQTLAWANMLSMKFVNIVTVFLGVYCMSWKIYIHGKFALKNVSERLDRTTLHQLLTLVDKIKVCVGHPDSNFVSMLQSKKGVIKTADGIKSAYLDEFIPTPCGLQTVYLSHMD